MKVIKRDGSKVDFDPVKIEQAVLKASVGDEPVRDAINDVVAMCQSEYRIGDLSVERIQDMVEIALGHANCTNTLRNYAHYREHRANARSINNIINDIYQIHDSNIANENANIDGNTNCSQRDFIASEISKQWALTQYLPLHARFRFFSCWWLYQLLSCKH